MFRISPWDQRCYRRFNPILLHWATTLYQKQFGGFSKKCSPEFLELISIYIVYCTLILIGPISRRTWFLPYLSFLYSVHWATGSRYIFIWSYKLRHFVQNLPPVKKWYRKFNPTFLHWATRFFFKYYLAYLLKILSPDFKGSLFYTVKHICFNIYRTRLPSVHRNMQSFSQPSPSSALVLWENCKSCI